MTDAQEEYSKRPYRQNVCAVVLNDKGQLLCCRRRDYPDTWQLPQGGREEGETPEEAVFRELEEEIGTKDLELLGMLDEDISYDWPIEVAHPRYRGQTQRYFLLRIQPSAIIDLEGKGSGEFDRYEWVGASTFIAKLDRSSRGGFKYAAYVKALEQLQAKFPGVISA